MYPPMGWGTGRHGDEDPSGRGRGRGCSHRAQCSACSLRSHRRRRPSPSASDLDRSRGRDSVSISRMRSPTSCAIAATASQRRDASETSRCPTRPRHGRLRRPAAHVAARPTHVNVALTDPLGDTTGFAAVRGRRQPPRRSTSWSPSSRHRSRTRAPVRSVAERAGRVHVRLRRRPVQPVERAAVAFEPCTMFIFETADPSHQGTFSRGDPVFTDPSATTRSRPSWAILMVVPLVTATTTWRTLQCSISSSTPHRPGRTAGTRPAMSSTWRPPRHAAPLTARPLARSPSRRSRCLPGPTRRSRPRPRIPTFSSRCRRGLIAGDLR